MCKGGVPTKNCVKTYLLVVSVSDYRLRRSGKSERISCYKLHGNWEPSGQSASQVKKNYRKLTKIRKCGMPRGCGYDCGSAVPRLKVS